MFFGAIVVGPPGSGKTTFCNALQQMFAALIRNVCIVNLDPANDDIPYTYDIDIRALVTVEDAMKRESLGPNGALMYCMNYVLKNIDWLLQQLQRQIESGNIYIVFDCPGQVELFTHQTSFLSILHSLTTKLNARLTAVHLLDSLACADDAKYISGILTSLSCQLMLELPHVNILTKIDLLKNHKKDMAFRLDYYTEVQDLDQMILHLAENCLVPDHSLQRKYIKLQQEICQLVESFNLCAFLPLDVNSKESVLRVIRHIDLANGFSLSGAFEDPGGLLKIAVGPSFPSDYTILEDIQETYIDTSDTDH